MWRYNYMYSTELYHYGVKGMKWGVRRTKENLAKSSGHVKLNSSTHVKGTGNRKEVRLDIKEYAHVMSELVTNITKEQKKKTVISKAIGNYLYSFENNFDGTYRIINKKTIPNAITGLFERDFNE